MELRKEVCQDLIRIDLGQHLDWKSLEVLKVPLHGIVQTENTNMNFMKNLQKTFV